jgi:molybdopterin molybdotransferase
LVQLTNDCFNTSSPLMTMEEAIALTAERLPVAAGIETIPLAHADGRIAAKTCFALSDLPPFANSAVDGYAVRHDNLAHEGGTVLRISGRLAAGASDPISVGRGAVRIFTGAPMPRDADTVFMQEDVSVDGDQLTVPPGLLRGSNMRPAGEDVARGAPIIEAGRRLRPQDLALAVAAGLDRIDVRRRLRITVFSTGDELAEPGTPLAKGAIYDSNRVMLGALLNRLGVEVRDLGILRDDPAVLSARLAAAAEGSDLILTSGGVSTGEEDHVKTAVETAGRLVFWRLAIKPGRPLAMGVVGGTPLIGLPGNPAAVYVTLAFFVRPILAHLGGGKIVQPMPQPVRAAFRAKKKVNRREFVRVSIARGEDGMPEAHKFPKEGAALLTSLTESDGLAELADAVTSIGVGDQIGFYPHELLW